MTISYQDRDHADELRLEESLAGRIRKHSRVEIERKNHREVMERMRTVSMCPPPIQSQHWLARVGRWIARKL